MNTLGKIFSSLVFGSGVGVTPYGVAVAMGGVPTSQEVIAEREEHGFGDDCLLDEELCEIMKDETWDPDTEEPTTKSGRPPDIHDDLLKPRWDDVCSWGFVIEEFNTLDQCKPEEKDISSSSTVKQ